jgi:hypothetical protein
MRYVYIVGLGRKTRPNSNWPRGFNWGEEAGRVFPDFSSSQLSVQSASLLRHDITQRVSGRGFGAVRREPNSALSGTDVDLRNMYSVLQRPMQALRKIEVGTARKSPQPATPGYSIISKAKCNSAWWRFPFSRASHVDVQSLLRGETRNVDGALR